ncbi:hypothetical protein V2J09_013667 [Rumex salicifolius]
MDSEKISIAPPMSGGTPPPLGCTVIMSPCAACKILRRRCTEKCVLAPYFPPTEPHKFTIAHRVFGASNIIKLVQELPASQRADAVSSMVYEANARVRDPVYGSAGAIFALQNQLSALQAELAIAQAEIVKMQCQQANLLALLCINVDTAANTSHVASSDHLPYLMSLSPTSPLVQDDFNSQVLFTENNWDPLWT